MDQAKETVVQGAQAIAHHAKAAVTQGNLLKDKIAIVTGASSGIGRAIALKYASEGAKVVIADMSATSRNPKEADITTHESIVKNGGESIYIKCDVTNNKDVVNVVAETVKKYGRLDIMVNNAGISAESQDPTVQHNVWDLPDEWWERTLAINQTGVFYCIRAASAQMIKQDPHPSGDRGWIVNLASVFGLVAVPGIFSYATSKHAVMGMTKAAALDLAPHRVHVNAINPGYVQSAFTTEVLKDEQVRTLATAQHPFRGLGEPEDIAGVALFLASENARWVTGTGVVVDGAYTAL